MSSFVRDWYQYYNIAIFDSIDSTNEEAKRIANTGNSGNYVIWAKSQTKGRGRSGNSWYSPKGNIYLSILLRPDFEVSKLSQLPFLVAVALGKTIKKFIPADKGLTYKWPNDILIEGKKAAGILIESSLTNNNVNWLVIGVGINLCDEPDLKNYLSTSLIKEGAKIPTIDMFVHELMQSFQFYLLQWTKEGFEDIRKEWLKNSIPKGAVITAKYTGNRVSGTFEGIDDKGNLQMQLSNNQTIMISSGEVFYSTKQFTE